jgi:hypothetical protein
MRAEVVGGKGPYQVRIYQDDHNYSVAQVYGPGPHQTWPDRDWAERAAGRYNRGETAGLLIGTVSGYYHAGHN